MIELECARLVISVHIEAKRSGNVSQTSSWICPSRLGCHVGRITKTEGVPDCKGLDSSTSIISILTISGPAHGIGRIDSSNGSVNSSHCLLCPCSGKHVAG